MAGPMPNSAKERTVRTLLKRPFNPRYSASRKIKNTFLEMKPINVINIWQIIDMIIFLIDFDVRESATIWGFPSKVGDSFPFPSVSLTLPHFLEDLLLFVMPSFVNDLFNYSSIFPSYLIPYIPNNFSADEDTSYP